VKPLAPSLLATLVIACACASQDGPFVAAGTPRMPLHEARPHCKQQSSSVAADGNSKVDWRAYERCMADLGWVKQPIGGSDGARLPTGGGSPY
jgi:hypothetical protein